MADAMAGRWREGLAEIDGLHQKLAAETASHDAMRAKIEEQIAGWEGKSSVEAKAALKARAEAEKARDQAKAAGTYKGKEERLSAADRKEFQGIADILNATLAMPRDVYLNLDDCGEANAYYSSEGPQIKFCNEQFIFIF